MFNLFPKKKSVDEIIEDANLTLPWVWTPTQTPSMLQAQNELIEQFLKENHDLKKEIQELKQDVHQPELCNEKILKLREENAQLKLELENWKRGVAAWRTQYDQEVAKNTKLEDEIKKLEVWSTKMNERESDMYKEVLSLRHLKQENADLMEMLAKYRDGYQGSCYACEPVGELNQKLEKEIDFLKKKLQIVQNDYKKCAEQSDEFKHQLNADNKDIKAQKHPIYPLHWGSISKPTWEEAASDLALKVTKLEEQLKIHKLLIDQLNKYILCQKQS